jgi:cation diffusion facilitator family transporter
MTSPIHESVVPVAQENARREKVGVAASSVAAAIFLTLTKTIVGIMTGSLGILSEAAHSALDLVAAAITLLAVRVSGRPADQVHTYGHGKIENLSALFEVILLLATCVWIIYEAVERLFFKHVPVDASVWAFATMALSIVVDFSRSRALARMAVKHRSQALEADALHFSTDIWSSLVVIGGLGLVLVARPLQAPWLTKADTAAAVGVAAIVVWVSVQLARRTVGDLLDAVAPGTREEIARAVMFAGVAEVRRVRVRRAGPEAFADLTLAIAGGTSLERAHDIADEAEAAVRALLPGADVMVHLEPAAGPGSGRGDSLAATVRRIAAAQGLGVHSIHVHDAQGVADLEVHLEVEASLSVAVAHQQATGFESAVRAAIGDVGRVVTHIEPRARVGEPGSSPALDEAGVLEVLREVAEEVGHFACAPHDVTVRRSGSGVDVSFHCSLDADTAITDAHALTEEIERMLRDRLPEVGRVVIHVEPVDNGTQGD